MRLIIKLIFGFIVIIVLVVGYFILRQPGMIGRSYQLAIWLKNPRQSIARSIKAGDKCVDAPFIFPTDGMIAYLWDDSFRAGHHHQGIDIFGGKVAGITPVYAAYPGFLTRLAEWKSSIIIRIPDDPLKPDRQIWTYYTHLADANGNSFITDEFPPGTQEVFVEAGTLLGYQGNYSGKINNPVGVHLHFSIVMDDGQGKFKNELEIKNTIDPSPYFRMDLNAQSNLNQVPVCTTSK